ncbi:hypothetical protein [Niallia sp. 01092]|uniref:hypothetical protein n=1 Tax=unclassified Niallia TaxID=2837522 RepID=UPI003FD11F2E
MVGKVQDGLCSCGSEKKWINCCGKKHILSLNHKIENELNNIQIDIFEYAINQYASEIDDYLEKCYKHLTVTPEIKDLLHFFTTTWLISCVELQGKTIMVEYIESFSDSIKGKRIKSLLQGWKQAQSAICIIQSYQDDYVTVQDIFTKQIYQIKLFDEEATIQLGGIVLGTILPAGETALFFTTYVEMPANISDGIVEAVLDLYENSEETEKTTFVSKNYPEVLALFFFGSSDVSFERLDWKNAKQRKVALLFVDFMMELDADEGMIDIVVHLWYQYCQRKNPNIKKPMIYVAALVYLSSQNLPYADILTQKELALKFGVSKSSISSKVTAIEHVLVEELENMHTTFATSKEAYPENLYPFYTEGVWEDEDALETEKLDVDDLFYDNSNKIISFQSFTSKRHDKL